MKLRISGDKLTFSSAHILAHHDKCSRLHGHNYIVEVEAEGKLNFEYMVVDFSKFKAIVAQTIKKLDHRVIIPLNSPEFEIVEVDDMVHVKTTDNKFYRFPLVDVVLLPLKATTAELLAEYIYKQIKKEFPELKINVSVSETPTSTAVYTE